MVSLSVVQASNAAIKTSLPAGLVAVFAGATAGIGEACLREFARCTSKPRIYFIGRSQESGDRLTAELKSLNPGGEYIFIKSDTSLLRNVDTVCKDIKAKETAINVLYLSQGSLNFNAESPEGLPYVMALSYYARARFMANLIPLIAAAAPALRRVVTVMAGGKEGKVYPDDFAGRNIPRTAGRGHLASMLTLSLEAAARRHPGVSFVHAFPGAVKTKLIRGDEGFAMQVFKYVSLLMFLGRWLPNAECGERQLFVCTSPRYAPKEVEKGATAAAAGATRDGDGDGEKEATGIDGKDGSGVYAVDWDGESAGAKAEEWLAKYRAEDMAERLWKHTEDEFLRITGSVAI